MRILKMVTTYLDTAHIRFKVNTFHVRIIITFLVFVIIKEILLRHPLYTILENMIY